MENLTIVKIRHPEKYKSLHQTYGILVQSMENTAVINFDSNKGGMCVNIAHEDYGVVSPNYWDILYGEVIIECSGGYIPTGLKIWS